MTTDASSSVSAPPDRPIERSVERQRQIVLIAVPDDKRVAGLTSALAMAGRPHPVLRSWQSVLCDPRSLRAAGQPGDFLRVESPGADSETWHTLAHQGGFTGSVQQGEWRPGQAWFVGLEQALRAIEESTSHLVPTHPSAHILTMTDKLWCAERLQAAGVPVPQTVSAPTTPDSLRELLHQMGRHAVFIKPRWGSSGAGVLAYRYAGHKSSLRPRRA